MAGITAFLENIAQFFITLMDFLASAVMGILQMVKMLPNMLSFLGTAISGLPNVVSAFALALIMISATYLIVGR